MAARYRWGGGLPTAQRTQARCDTPRAPVAVAAFGGAVPLRPRLVVGKDAVRRMIDDPARSVVACTRSWAEHVGEISGYDAITARGRIRGSVWGHSGSDAHHVQDFEAPDGTLRDADELAALWAAAGITAGRHVAFYCGTGWRASLPCSTPGGWAGRGPRSTTRAGSSGARTPQCPSRPARPDRALAAQ